MKSWLSRFLRDDTATSDFEYRRIIGISRSETHETPSDFAAHIWKRGEQRRDRVQASASGNVRALPGSRDVHPAHGSRRVWSYDIFRGHTADQRNFCVLTVIDEQTGVCLATRIERNIACERVMVVLAELFEEHGAPAYVRPLRGSVEISIGVRNWLNQRRGKTALIEAEYQSERAYRETLSGQLRDWIKTRIFRSPNEAQTLIENWLSRFYEQKSYSA